MAYATDDFNRANETPLAGNWTQVGDAQFNLASNQVTVSTSGDRFAYWNPFTPGDDQESAALFPVVDSSNWDGGPAVRIGTSTPLDGYITTPTAGSGGQCRVSMFDGGSWSSLSTGGTAPTSGETMRLDANGTTIESFVEGSSQTSVTDSTHTGGRVGIFIYTSLELDDWAGGDLGGAGAANPKGPLGMPLHGPLAGPIGSFGSPSM